MYRSAYPHDSNMSPTRANDARPGVVSPRGGGQQHPTTPDLVSCDGSQPSSTASPATPMQKVMDSRLMYCAWGDGMSPNSSATFPSLQSANDELLVPYKQLYSIGADYQPQGVALANWKSPQVGNRIGTLFDTLKDNCHELVAVRGSHNHFLPGYQYPTPTMDIGVAGSQQQWQSQAAVHGNSMWYNHLDHRSDLHNLGQGTTSAFPEHQPGFAPPVQQSGMGDQTGYPQHMPSDEWPQASQASSAVDAEPPRPAATCSFCDTHFNGKYAKSNKNRHENRFHNLQASTEGLTCRQCNKLFKRKDATKKHEWEKHGLVDVKPKKRGTK